MTDFIATLAPQRSNNWEICKRHKLWGIVGQGSNWKKNAELVRAGDRIFIWRGGRRQNGFIAEVRALGPVNLVGEPGVRVPWPDPEWFGGVFPIEVVREAEHAIPDRFPNENGRFGVRFGFNNTALQHIFEKISPMVASRIAEAFAAETGQTRCGVPYTPSPRPAPISQSEPFAVDPDLVDRGLAAHHDTVASLADWVYKQGHTPLLPGISDPKFDLAWFSGDQLNVAEVKSIRPANEESQLRLGLGQVLRYRHQLSGNGRIVKAWLIPEQQPTDGTWTEVCSSVGVQLSWPALW